MTEGKPMYGIRGGLAHDAGSGSFVSWDNTKCNPLASAREQARSAWEDGYASAKRKWVGLTDEDMQLLVEQARTVPTEVPCPDYNERLLALANAKLKEKNT